MSTYTPTPWLVSNGYIRNENRIIFNFRKSNYEEIANAVRTVACVNACECLEDPSVVPTLLRLAKEGLIHMGNRASSRKEHAELRALEDLIDKAERK